MSVRRNPGEMSRPNAVQVSDLFDRCHVLIATLLRYRLIWQIMVNKFFSFKQLEILRIAA